MLLTLYALNSSISVNLTGSRHLEMEFVRGPKIMISDWIIFIWSQGLVPLTIHMQGPKHNFGEQLPGTCPTNSNQFELVGQVAGTIYWSLRLDFL